MKISIVTISFNQEKYIKDCIESVLRQDYQNIEYIIVDPGSTDGSREIISSYGDKIITLFNKDDGPADGLNKGFSLATGDIFYFLNADDYLENNSISRVMNAFNNSNANVVLGCGSIDFNGTKKSISPEPLDLNLLMLRACKIFQQGTFFKRDIFLKSGGFNKINKTCWDYELFVKFASLNASCLLINENLASFRIHADSISGSGRLNIQYIKDLERIYYETTGKRWGFGSRTLSLITRLNRYTISRLVKFHK